MKEQALQTHDQRTAAYLSQLQALASELSVAMDAIAAYALTSFQESVDRQEMLCAELQTMAPAISEIIRSSRPMAGDTPVEQEIQATTGTIRELNLQYAALLKHSGRSIAILASLCRSHTGQTQEAHGPRLKRHTWSCEM
jgi:hypothetical protein